MYKIGISSGNKLFNEEAFGLLKESHIDAIEISVPYDMYDSIDYKKTKRLSEINGIELWSYHLPFVPFSEIEPSSLDKNVRIHTIEYFSELMKKASDIGINKFVIHPSGEPIENSEREERLKMSMETLNSLAEVAHTCGGVIAIENLPRTCLGKNSEEIKKLISCNNKLKVCFDTNHLLNENNIDFIKNLKNDIITVHISDYDFVDERHWLPGEGKTNWLSMIDAFRDIDYKGVWMYEVSVDTPANIIRDRNLTYRDFFENANAIFKKAKIPVIGKPAQ